MLRHVAGSDVAGKLRYAEMISKRLVAVQIAVQAVLSSRRGRLTRLALNLNLSTKACSQWRHAALMSYQAAELHYFSSQCNKDCMY